VRAGSIRRNGISRRKNSEELMEEEFSWGGLWRSIYEEEVG